MDDINRVPVERSTPPQQSQVSDKPKKKGGKLKVFLVALLFLAIGAGAGYYYADMKAQEELDSVKQEVVAVKAEKAKLEKDLADSKEAAKKTTVVASKEVTQAQIDNIIASVGSGNYAAIQQYLADPVKVVIAASEFSKDLTSVKALVELKYLDSAKDPWNFELPEATLTTYKNGDYKTYFVGETVVGKSTDGKVVAFGFNDEAKIDTIFMAASADIL
jgi:hypothetical protein